MATFHWEFVMLFISHALITLRDRLEAADKEQGATVVEYALVLSVISLIVIGGAAVMTGAVQALWGEIAALL